MKEIPFCNLNRVCAPNTDTFLLAAPNFEPRSTISIQAFLNAFGIPLQSLCSGLITLQASAGRVEPLEELKRQNHKAAVSFLVSKTNRMPEHFEVSYPEDFSGQSFIRRIREWITSRSKPVTLFLDVSCLPKLLMVNLVTLIDELYDKGHIIKAFALYTWADEYPLSRYASQLGQLRTVYSNDPLSEELLKNRRVQAIVFIGRQGFDAKMFLDMLPKASTKHVFIFMNRDNPIHSLEVMRANSPVILTSYTNIHYFNSLSAGHRHLMSLVSDITSQCDTLLMAPFGPKPLIWSICKAISHFRKSKQGVYNLNTLADLVSLSSHHYGTLYSLGNKSTSLYHLQG